MWLKSALQEHYIIRKSHSGHLNKSIDELLK